jgi:chromosome segregation ATPase
MASHLQEQLSDSTTRLHAAEAQRDAIATQLRSTRDAHSSADAAVAVAESQRNAAADEVAALRSKLAQLHVSAAKSVHEASTTALQEVVPDPDTSAGVVGMQESAGSTDAKHNSSPAEQAAVSMEAAAAKAASALLGGGDLLRSRNSTPIVSRIARLLDRAAVQGLLRSELHDELQRQAAHVASLRAALDTAQSEVQALTQQLSAGVDLLRSARSLSKRARAAEGRSAVLLELLGEKQEELDCLQGELHEVRDAFKEQLSSYIGGHE